VLTLSSAVLIKGSYRSTIYKSEWSIKCLLVDKCLDEAPIYLAYYLHLWVGDISGPQCMAIWQYRAPKYGQSFDVSGPTPLNTPLPTLSDLSLTLTQFCAVFNTVLFCI